MRIADRPLLLFAWTLALAGFLAASAQAQSQTSPKPLPPPHLAATPEEPIPFNRTTGRPQLRTVATKPEALHAGAKTAPLPVPPPHPGAAQNEPLPLPPKPPPVPPPPPTPPQAAEKLPEPEKPEGQPSKLPRFASLRADEVNMRVGPGSRYRIDWVYKRRELPVEIIREFDVWRYVRDPDGIQGWMQQATLMGRRTFIVQSADATLREEPKDGARAVAVLKVGVIGRIRSCEASADWCQVQAGSYRGYLRREQFWGTLPHEAVNP